VRDLFDGAEAFRRKLCHEEECPLRGVGSTMPSPKHLDTI
jgi:hypothetical protein